MTTTLSPADLRHMVLVFDGSFAIGLRVSKCRTWYETDPRRLWDEGELAYRW